MDVAEEGLQLSGKQTKIVLMHGRGELHDRQVLIDLVVAPSDVDFMA